MADDPRIRDQQVEPWERHPSIECVECPDCAFLFSADHTDGDGTYSCPACAEICLTALLADHAAETERLRRDLRAEQRTVSTAADDLREARAENERLLRRFAVARELADWGYDVQRVMRDGNAHYLDSLEGLREWFGPEVGTEPGELDDLQAALAAAQEPPAKGDDDAQG